MACGLQYLAQHVYRYEAQHPPLARVMSALGPYLAGARPLGIKNQDQEGVAVMYRDGHPAQMLTRMRLGILPFFVVAAFVVWLWARRYFGGAAAALAAGLFTLVPTVLAHAGVATTDMPLTACLSAAFFALLLWAGSAHLAAQRAAGRHHRAGRGQQVYRAGLSAGGRGLRASLRT